jgi:hypothetical protein
MTTEQNGIVAALARHYKVKKQLVLDEIKANTEDENSPITTVNLNKFNEHHYRSLVIGVTKTTIALGKTIFFKTFSKTDFYSEAVNLLKNCGAEVVVFYTGGQLMSVSLGDFYEGLGGIFVRKDMDEITGYVIEPFVHYLEYFHTVHVDL